MNPTQLRGIDELISALDSCIVWASENGVTSSVSLLKMARLDILASWHRINQAELAQFVESISTLVAARSKMNESVRFDQASACLGLNEIRANPHVDSRRRVSRKRLRK